MSESSVVERSLTPANLSSSEVEKWLHTRAGNKIAGQGLRRLKTTIRWADWALSKIPALCLAASFSCLVHRDFAAVTLSKLFVFCYVFAVANAALGYLLNDFADRAIDRAQGKTNVFDVLCIPQGVACVALAAAAMVCASLQFIKQPGFVSLWLLSLSLSLAYSLKPIRLKERGAIGIFAAATAMCGLPILLMSVSLGYGCDWQAVLLAILCTVNGATIEVGHQRFDRTGDKSTGTATLGARVSLMTMNRVYGSMLLIDRMAIAAMLALVTIACVSIGPVSGAVAVSVVGIYLFALTKTILRIQRGEFIDPHFGSRLLEDRLLHTVIPGFLLPVCTIIAISCVAPIWLCLLGWFIAWRFALYL